MRRAGVGPRDGRHLPFRLRRAGAAPDAACAAFSAFSAFSAEAGPDSWAAPAAPAAAASAAHPAAAADPACEGWVDAQNVLRRRVQQRLHGDHSRRRRVVRPLGEQILRPREVRLRVDQRHLVHRQQVHWGWDWPNYVQDRALHYEFHRV